MTDKSKSDNKLGLYLRLMLNREVATYLVAGLLTTLVNLVVFALLSSIFGHDRWWLSNAPAIFAAILFAYFLNRFFVFRSHGPFWLEMYKFFLSRIFVSLIFEYGAMYLLYNAIGLSLVLNILGGEILLSKLLTQLFVVVGNYVISKFFVFERKAGMEKKADEL